MTIVRRLFMKRQFHQRRCPGRRLFIRSSLHGHVRGVSAKSIVAFLVLIKKLIAAFYVRSAAPAWSTAQPGKMALPLRRSCPCWANTSGTNGAAAVMTLLTLARHEKKLTRTVLETASAMSSGHGPLPGSKP